MSDYHIPLYKKDIDAALEAQPDISELAPEELASHDDLNITGSHSHSKDLRRKKAAVEGKAVLPRGIPSKAPHEYKYTPEGYASQKGRSKKRDKFIIDALAAGVMKVHMTRGIVYATRGPGGKPLAKPKPYSLRDNDGYLQFTCTHNGEFKTLFVHRVIFIAAHGIPPEPPPGELPYQVDHIDGNRHNNSIDNLRLVTPQGNAANRVSNSGEDNPMAKLTQADVEHIRELRSTRKKTVRELAYMYKVSETTIRLAVRGITWRPEKSTDKDGKGKRIMKPGPTEGDLAAIPISVLGIDGSNPQMHLPPKTRTARSYRSKMIRDLLQRAENLTPPQNPEHPVNKVLSTIEPVIDTESIRADIPNPYEYNPDSSVSDTADDPNQWYSSQQILLERGQQLSSVPDLYEHVKTTYTATYGNATLTARMCGISRATVLRYAAKDNWPCSLDPESIKTSVEKSSLTKLHRLAEVLEHRLMDMADSMVVEEKERHDLNDKGLGSMFVASLSQRSGAFATLFDRYMRIMTVLYPEVYLNDVSTKNPQAQRLRDQQELAGGVDGINRQLAAFFSGIALGTGATSPTQCDKQSAPIPAELIDGSASRILEIDPP